MTNWREFPLRPHGQRWPGLNTRGGRIMTLGGEMSDCTNVVINRDDILEKRKGLVRGLNERFNGVVCGLFKYTDDCGREKLIVADELGFAIREPFTLPLFQIADCYPFDNFSMANGEPLDEDNWKNASRYEHFSDAMVQRSGTAQLPSDDDSDLPVVAARWFKDACSRSYRVRVTYQFDDSSSATQRLFLIIRGNGDLLTGAMILGVVDFLSGTTYRMSLIKVSASRVFTTLGTADLAGADNGTATISYNQSSRVPTLVVDPVAGPLKSLSGSPLSELEDLDLGLVSGMGIAHRGTSQPGTDFRISVVDGGSI